MPSTRDIRRRIKSVQSTRQVTKAMKMVSAAKLRRAQERMLAVRPYAGLMQRVLSSLASRANPDLHPLLADRGDDRIEVVVLTGDRGLCGGFNTNVLKRAMAFLMEKGAKTKGVHCIGKKGRDFFRRRNVPIAREYVDVFRNVRASQAREIAEDLIHRFIAGELDAIYLIYNEFKSVLQQRVVVTRLLPIERAELRAGETVEDYIYEPDPRHLFDVLIPRYVAAEIYHAMLESGAAEHGARMAAMESATTNADEMIQSLTLYMNRVRQASITKEIIEVVSGAGAL
jgi:F-type H+-transporting ATPase subunit gamma